MKNDMKCKRWAWVALLMCGAAAQGWAQHEHHMMHVSAAKLTVTTDSEKREMAAKLGPLNLPAHSDHSAMAQPGPQFVVVPFDGWITAYHPSLVDDAYPRRNHGTNSGLVFRRRLTLTTVAAR